MKSLLSRVASLTGYLFIFTAFVLTTLAFAEEAPKFGDSLVNLVSAIKVGTVGAILLAVGQLLKSDLVSNLIKKKVNTKYLPWTTVVIGILISVGASWGTKSWYINVIEGVVAALLSNGIFDQTKPLA